MNDQEQPTHAAGYAERAFWFIERRRLDDARRVLKEGLALHPQDPDLLFHIAQTEWLADDATAAEATVRQVLVVSPGHEAARQLLATLLADRGELADAEQLLIGLLREYPERADLYGRYSRLMLRALHLEKAEKLANEGLRYDPDDAECLTAAALCETARSGARGNDKLVKLLTAHPESLSTTHTLTVALVDSGRIDEAHRIAQGAMRADPANSNLVELVRELRIQNHWSMKPLWPLQKWGWGGSVALWVGAIVILNVLKKSAPGIAFPVAVIWIGYAVYSWVWPSILRRLM